MFNAKNQASMISRSIARAIDSGDIKTAEQVEQEIRNVCDALENKAKGLIDRVVKHRTCTHKNTREVKEPNGVFATTFKLYKVCVDCQHKKYIGITR